MKRLISLVALILMILQLHAGAVNARPSEKKEAKVKIYNKCGPKSCNGTPDIAVYVYDSRGKCIHDLFVKKGSGTVVTLKPGTYKFYGHYNGGGMSPKGNVSKKVKVTKDVVLTYKTSSNDLSIYVVQD